MGVFAKATLQDTPKAVVTKTDEPMRRFEGRTRKMIPFLMLMQRE